MNIHIHTWIQTGHSKGGWYLTHISGAQQGNLKSQDDSIAGVWSQLDAQPLRHLEPGLRWLRSQACWPKASCGFSMCLSFLLVQTTQGGPTSLVTETEKQGAQKHKTEAMWPHKALFQIPHSITVPLFTDLYTSSLSGKRCKKFWDCVLHVARGIFPVLWCPCQPYLLWDCLLPSCSTADPCLPCSHSLLPLYRGLWILSCWRKCRVFSGCI